MTQSDRAAEIRRLVGWALVAGLSLAALTAIVAVVSGDFGDTDGRVIFTSIGFALCSGVGGIGATQRLRAAPALRVLGTVTVGLSALSFVLLVLGLWTGDWGSEGIWRTWGCVSLVGLTLAHACVMLGARRASDRRIVVALTLASVMLAGIDTLGGLLPISGAVEEVDESLEEALEKALGVSLVLLVLTSVLPPLLRRLQAPRPPTAAQVDGRGDALDLLTAEVVTAAQRIEELARGPALRTPEIRREAERLRDLARSFRR